MILFGSLGIRRRCRETCKARFNKAELLGGDAKFEALVATVVGLVEEPRRGALLPLDVRGTAFKQKVWRALVAMRAGETLSYADIAARIGAPEAVRSNGALGGYAWGIDRKRMLLEREYREHSSGKRP